MSERPCKKFTYPGEAPMCLAGQTRAATLSDMILAGEIAAEKIEASAKRGQIGLDKGASTPKHRIIDLIVYRHARSGDLDQFVDDDGNFIGNSGEHINIRDRGLPDRVRRQVRSEFSIE